MSCGEVRCSGPAVQHWTAKIRFILPSSEIHLANVTLFSLRFMEMNRRFCLAFGVCESACFCIGISRTLQFFPPCWRIKKPLFLATLRKEFVFLPWIGTSDMWQVHRGKGGLSFPRPPNFPGQTAALWGADSPWSTAEQRSSRPLFFQICAGGSEGSTSLVHWSRRLMIVYQSFRCPI